MNDKDFTTILADVLWNRWMEMLPNSPRWMATKIVEDLNDALAERSRKETRTEIEKIIDDILSKCNCCYEHKSDNPCHCHDQEKSWHKRMDFNTWLTVGIDRGFCGIPVCATHDGIPPIDEEEAKEWQDGYDPCQQVVRILYDN